MAEPANHVEADSEADPVADPARDFFRTALDLGAVCCLAKPFKSAELLQAVETCRAAAVHKVA